MNNKSYDVEASELIGEWDNVSTNVGKTSTPWGVIHWCLHLGMRSPNDGFTDIALYQTPKGEYFTVIRAGWEERISKIETDLSPDEWAMRIDFMNNGYISDEYSNVKTASIYTPKAEDEDELDENSRIAAEAIENEELNELYWLE